MSWYGQLDATERRPFWACFAGFGLDSMDNSIYALVIPVLIATLGVTRPEAGYLATAALVGAALGGWGAGVAADRIGSVRSGSCKGPSCGSRYAPSAPRSRPDSRRWPCCASARAWATAARRRSGPP
jgi:MFS family permease